MCVLDFRKDSENYVSMISSRAGIIPDKADDTQTVDDSLPLAGIFADDMPQNIVTRVYNYDLKCVILRGSESETMMDNLRRTLVPDIVSDIMIVKE